MELETAYQYALRRTIKHVELSKERMEGDISGRSTKVAELRGIAKEWAEIMTALLAAKQHSEVNVTTEIKRIKESYSARQ